MLFAATEYMEDKLAAEAAVAAADVQQYGGAGNGEAGGTTPGGGGGSIAGNFPGECGCAGYSAAPRSL